MPDLDRRPAYRLTQAQAADLLGVSTARVAELVAEGRLTPCRSGQRRACYLRTSTGARFERWKPGDSTWMTTTEVAAMLGVTQPRVSQLARRGFLRDRSTAEAHERVATVGVPSWSHSDCTSDIDFQ